MFIVFENKSYQTVLGSHSAPYLDNTLIPGCGLATNYHNYSHPSTQNYLAMTSGMVQGKAASADCQPKGCPQSQASIFSQLGSAGQTWREYAEAMPGNCDKANYDNTGYHNADGSTGEYYYVRHAPPPYYTSAPVPAECLNWDVPLGTTSSGALSRAVPGQRRASSIQLVTPGGCDDMHDCSITAGDDWLSQWIPIIQAPRPTKTVSSRSSSPGMRAPARTRRTARRAGIAHMLIRHLPSCHVATIVMSPYTTQALGQAPTSTT